MKTKPRDVATVAVESVDVDASRQEHPALYCIVLYLYIYIALLAVHTNQKRFQCERPREKRAVLRERKEGEMVDPGRHRAHWSVNSLQRSATKSALRAERCMRYVGRANDQSRSLE